MNKKEKIMITILRLATGDMHEERFYTLITKDIEKYPDADINCIIENCIPENQHQEIFKQKILFALRLLRFLGEQ